MECGFIIIIIIRVHDIAFFKLQYTSQSISQRIMCKTVKIKFK